MGTDFKTYRVGGTRRICSPAETWARVQPLLAACGVTRIANVTGLDHVGIPVVMVFRPNGASLSVSQGKGTDLAAAKVSGVMEAFEHHCAESFAPHGLRLASSIEIAAEGGVPEARWPKGTEPRRARQKQLWIRAETRRRSLGQWVPFELVHLDLTIDHPLAHHAFPLSSNGLASGNSWEEAVLHGTCELIERDALALFYDLPPQLQLQRRLDPRSASDETVRSLLERFERASLQLALWDVTSDIGVAAILCAVLESNPDASRRNGVAMGVGCHPERDVAVSRALCEAAQSRLTRIAGSRDDILPDIWASVRSVESEVRWRSLMAESPSLRSLAEVPDHRHDTLGEDLDFLERQLHARGLDPLQTVCLSAPSAPVCVVRSLVPGLEVYSEAEGGVRGARALAQRVGVL